MLASKEIRDLFINYFKDNGHQHVASSPVIPAGDPTLLFINAGMNQFKDVFLGNEQRGYSRAVSSQKCVRAGGKHNDLDNVGFTARHHTFFEMLGNFSFGDYFKDDAIFFCWDLLHNKLKLPKEKLWATVYMDDDEAIKIWKKVSGLPDSRIIKLGKKDNFWSMGDTGPCGPCSEVIIDQGEQLSCGPNCGIGTCECDRYLELWNLVFMQFNRSGDGSMSPLPKPSIDTGMGLERITSVLQGVKSNFDTDLLSPIIRSIEKLSGKKYYSDDRGTPFRVIADHTRCLAFALADGAYPSNEGRGYVLRKILRRGFRFGLKLGIDEPFIYKIVSEVSSIMSDTYPELEKKQKDVQGIVYNEELRFKETLSEGMKRINDVLSEMKSVNSSTIAGDQIFKLYDTYGIPMDIIEDVAKEEHLGLDVADYENLMRKQKDMAKSARKEQSGKQSNAVFESIKSGMRNPVSFDGYDKTSLSTKILYIIKDGVLADTVTEGDEVEVVLESTPCYCESGGQIGDWGRISAGSSEIAVFGTYSPVVGVISHKGKVIKGVLSKNDPVIVEIDIERRLETRRHHSATHLLHCALRAVLGDHVRQSGSLVEPDRLRFDFTHFKALTDEEIEKVTVITNSLIRDNILRKTEIKSIKEAREEGAMALFGEKYADIVRVVSFDSVSKELCGGTHVDSTGEIGFFIIASESSVASGVRRVEALCSKSAQEYIINRERLISKICSMFRTSALEITDKIEKFIDDKKKLEKNINNLQAKKGIDDINAIISESKNIKGINVLAKNCGDANQETLRNIADAIKQKVSSYIICLGAKNDNQINFLVIVAPDLVKQGYHAGNIIKKIAQSAGGNGGGRPDMAQAGAKDIDKLDTALNEVFGLI